MWLCTYGDKFNLTAKFYRHRAQRRISFEITQTAVLFHHNHQILSPSRPDQPKSSSAKLFLSTVEFQRAKLCHCWLMWHWVSSLLLTDRVREVDTRTTVADEPHIRGQFEMWLWKNEIIHTQLEYTPIEWSSFTLDFLWAHSINIFRFRLLSITKQKLCTKNQNAFQDNCIFKHTLKLSKNYETEQNLTTK